METMETTGAVGRGLQRNTKRRPLGFYKKGTGHIYSQIKQRFEQEANVES